MCTSICMFICNWCACLQSHLLPMGFHFHLFTVKFPILRRTAIVWLCGTKECFGLSSTFFCWRPLKSGINFLNGKETPPLCAFFRSNWNLPSGADWSLWRFGENPLQKLMQTSTSSAEVRGMLQLCARKFSCPNTDSRCTSLTPRTAEKNCVAVAAEARLTSVKY